MLIILTVVLVSAFLMAVGIRLRIIRFSVINDSKYDVGIKMEYVDNDEDVLLPSGFHYLNVPPDGKTYTYTVLKTDYYFTWWSGDGVCLKPVMELAYDKPSDSLVLTPLFSTILRFKQCYNPPQWYFDWLDAWDLKWNYIYNYMY